MKTDDEGRQRHVYFMSKMLTDAETRYTKFEQIALALRMATKKLRLYFQAHTIVVLTSYPIRAILHKLDASEKLLKWAVKLSEFNIVYCLRSSTKGQVLINFIAELSNMPKDSISEPLKILETKGSSKAVGEGAVWCYNLRRAYPLPGS